MACYQVEVLACALSSLQIPPFGSLKKMSGFYACELLCIRNMTSLLASYDNRCLHSPQPWILNGQKSDISYQGENCGNLMTHLPTGFQEALTLNSMVELVRCLIASV